MVDKLWWICGFPHYPKQTPHDMVPPFPHSIKRTCVWANPLGRPIDFYVRFKTRDCGFLHVHPVLGYSICNSLWHSDVSWFSPRLTHTDTHIIPASISFCTVVPPLLLGQSPPLVVSIAISWTRQLLDPTCQLAPACVLALGRARRADPKALLRSAADADWVWGKIQEEPHMEEPCLVNHPILEVPYFPYHSPMVML